MRYQRWTPMLVRVVDAVAVHLAGKAGARLLLARQWGTLLRCLLALPLPDLPTPGVLGVNDFALRRRHHYATILIDALTHRRIQVLPDRMGETLTGWLRAYPGVEVVCRDSYAQAVADALPDAVQVSDRLAPVARPGRGRGQDRLRPPPHSPCQQSTHLLDCPHNR